MTEKTIELSLPVLVPQLGEACDQCLARLEAAFQHYKGIRHAHVEADKKPPQLCIHYDPNLVSLSAVERIATQAGSEFSTHYRHEQIPFADMDVADAALSLAEQLTRLPGMVHAQVNYAAGLAFVAYDTTQLQRPAIERLIRQQGFKVLPTQPVLGQPHNEADHEADLAAHPAPGEAAHAHAGHDHAGHDHGSAPAFLPHWMQERWPLLLVAAAGLFLLIGWAGETFFALSPTVAWGFYLLAYVAGGYDVATHAIPGLLKGRFDTDVLMLAAAGGAAILGEWGEGAFLLFLFALGHAGEHYALDRARNAVNALGALMPKSALVKRDTQWVSKPVESVMVDDLVLVRPGERIPVDGQIIQGQSTVDQSPITGESQPISRTPGDPVFAGTVNQSNALEIQVGKLAKDNTLSRILHLVAEAQSQQSPTQRFTQQFTRWFVPTILVVVLMVICLPPLLGWMALSASFYRAMLLLVAASPCALAIGTPAAVLAGIAQAARNGVLIKGGVHLENLGRLRVMAFDKTGTLTTGKFAVTDVIPLAGQSSAELLRVAAAVEQQSTHPLAQAVVTAAQAQHLTLPVAADLENLPGLGVRSQLGVRTIRIGSRHLFAASQPLPDTVLATVERLEAAGRSTMIIGQDETILGVLGLADQPRAGVATVLTQLRRLGMAHLVMLTGDHRVVAEQIAQTVGISDVRAELLPEAKLRAIHQLQAQYGPIAMTGDGVNDAPALAAANVGIAMGGAGTAVALETADVALMADDLTRLPFAVGLSRASRTLIYQNLGISLGVIALLIVTSVFGWLQLSGAVILHEGSTILVVLNALRLLRYRLD